MEHIVKSVIVPAKPERVFPLISTPKYVSRLLPGKAQISDVESLPMGGWRYRWMREFLGVRFEGGALVTVSAYAHKLMVRRAGGLVVTEVWTLQPDDEGTRVTLACDFVLPPPLLQKHERDDIYAGFVQDVEQTLTNLCTLVEMEHAETVEQPE
jgi:uncharacterized protein YndB with AHSA1/START domain